MTTLSKTKITKQKKLIIEQLQKVPIVQISCDKVNIARATYYRWRQSDKKFLQDTDQAILDGSLWVNDVAESQLLTAIKSGNLSSIVFWLKNHHPAYANKLEVTSKYQSEDENLTPHQKKLISEAIKLATMQDDKSLPTNTKNSCKKSQNNKR